MMFDLAKAMEAKGVTRSVLAKRIGVMNGNIWNIEHGKQKNGPTLYTIDALAKGLRISRRELLELSGWLDEEDE